MCVFFSLQHASALLQNVKSNMLCLRPCMRWTKSVYRHLHFYCALHRPHCQIHTRITKYNRTKSLPFLWTTSNSSTTLRLTSTLSPMDATARKQLLQPYEPPHWAADLKIVPKYKVQVCSKHKSFLLIHSACPCAVALASYIAVNKITKNTVGFTHKDISND